MKVKLLDTHVVNCISAGEVVQRPESVVRELVDNAVDAGATEISIYIEEGGESLIRVVDNGCGMSKEDAVLAFKRHATSKISEVEDLDKITTMGFRGEALPSISAVSKLRLRTREKESKTATEVIINGGTISSISEVSANIGTDIEIRNLFFNVPARKKFLRTAKTESQRIKNWIRAMVLAYPKIRVNLYIDSKDSLIFAPREDVFKRAGDLYQGSIVRFQNENSEIKVEGIVAHPALAKSDAGAFIILVNKRFITSKMLLKAVKEGFKNTLKNGEIPVGFLLLQIAPHLVDVNVHPQKMEVRFTNESAVFAFVRNTVDRATANFTGVVDMANMAPIKEFESQGQSQSHSYGNYNSNFFNKGFQDSFQKDEVDFTNNKEFFLNGFSSNDFGNGNVALNQNLKEENTPSENFFGDISNDFKFSNLKYIGQLFKCYLLCEYNDFFYVVDMHAGHERVNYNKLRREFKEKHISVQDLLVPLSVELGEQKTEYLLNHKNFLESFGIYIEGFGKNQIVVRALPQIIGEYKVVNLLQNISNIEMSELAENMTENLISDISARLACHASIRSGHVILKEEVYELFKMLDSEEFSSACPHGRPILRRFSKVEVEKWFGRDR